MTVPPAQPASTQRPPGIVMAAAAIATLYGWAIVALTPAHPGSIGPNLNALGTDWLVFYGGARWFFDGRLASLFDGDQFTAWLNTAFGWWLSQPIQFRPWVYPPSYLLLLLPFGALPVLASYASFQIVTAALLAAALWFGAEQRQSRLLVVAGALLGPAAALNTGMGQNAFLSAALLIGGFRLLRRHPALGGALLGLMTIKPQFWLLVPVALIAAREWRALAWSLAAAAALALASAALFGLDFWREWLRLARSSYSDAGGQWMELGRLWGDSIYACLVAAGAPQGLANAVQIAGTLLAAVAAFTAFRLPLSTDRRIAVLLAASVLAAPHSSLADMVLLAGAAALWAGAAVAEKTRLGPWTLALALWIAVLFNPPVISPIGRLTPLLVLAFIAMLLAAPLQALAAHRRQSPGAAPRLAAEE